MGISRNEILDILEQAIAGVGGASMGQLQISRGEPLGGATDLKWGIQLNAIGEYGVWKFFLGDQIDTTEDVKVIVPFQRRSAGGDTIDIILRVGATATDGVAAESAINIENATPKVLPACAANRLKLFEYTLVAANIDQEDWIYFRINLNELDDVYLARPYIQFTKV